MREASHIIGITMSTIVLDLVYHGLTDLKVSSWREQVCIIVSIYSSVWFRLLWGMASALPW